MYLMILTFFGAFYIYLQKVYFKTGEEKKIIYFPRLNIFNKINKKNTIKIYTSKREETGRMHVIT